jgi:hypothetical protein
MTNSRYFINERNLGTRGQSRRFTPPRRGPSFSNQALSSHAPTTDVLSHHAPSAPWLHEPDAHFLTQDRRPLESSITARDREAFHSAPHANADATLVDFTLGSGAIDLTYDPSAPKAPARDLRFVEGAMLAMGETKGDFLGWDKSGFNKSHDHDYGDKRGHDEKIILEDRLDRQVEFHISDTASGSAQSAMIHNWDITTPRTDQLAYFRQTGPVIKTTRFNPAYSASIFIKPLGDQIIVYPFVGKEGTPFEGCHLNLILGLDNAGSKRHVHKKTPRLASER